VGFQVAKTKCSLLSLDTRALTSVLAHHPESAAKFQEEIISRYQNYERVIVSGTVRLQDGTRRTKELWLDGVAREDTSILQSTRRMYELPLDVVLTEQSGTSRIFSSFDSVVVWDRARSPDCVCGTRDSMRKNCVLHPKGNRKIAWDTFVGILVVYTLIAVPVEIAFLSEDEYFEMVWLGLAVDIFFLLDMLVSSRTAYYDMDAETLEVHPKAILVYYLERWFWIDLLSS